MAAIADTRKILQEVEAILKANPAVDYVSTGALEPLASEENKAAIYISGDQIVLEDTRLTPNASGYDRHFLISLYGNYDASEDTLGVYDFSDSIERCLLDDTSIWGNLVDRDIAAINFDNQEHYPMRSFTMLLDVTFRLTCN